MVLLNLKWLQDYRGPYFFFKHFFFWVWYDPHLTYFGKPSKVKLFWEVVGTKKPDCVWPWTTIQSRSVQAQSNPKNKHFALFLYPFKVNPSLFLASAYLSLPHACWCLWSCYWLFHHAVFCHFHLYVLIPAGHDSPSKFWKQSVSGYQKLKAKLRKNIK